MPKKTANADLSRRDVVGSLALTGLGLIIVGCQSGGRRVTPSASLPGPVWPDQEAGGDRMIPVPPAGQHRGGTLTAAIPQGVIPRSTWTRATPIRNRADPMGTIWRITIHHDAMNSADLRSQADVAYRLEKVRAQHTREWADIGYHFIIDPAGRVWEGRPLSLQGAHVKDNNPGNMGVMLMGNFNEQRPTQAQVNSLDAFVSMQARTYRVNPRNIFTHRELMPTQCPGASLQQYMLATRSRGGRLAVAMA